MRLLLTVVGTTPQDVAVDCEDDATVADLARQLAGHAPAQPRTLGAVRTAVASPPALWLRGRPLDPAQPLALSALRNGAVVGVDVALPDVLAEPVGLVEIRVAGGPGSGRVQRLSPGMHPVGTDPSCAVRLSDPGLPPVACWVEVGADGAVLLRPDPSVVGVTRPAAARMLPLDGPIVVPRDAADLKRRRMRKRKARAEARVEMLAGEHLDIDPAADIPLLHLERQPVRTDTPWLPGVALCVGSVLLELSPVTGPDASLSPSPGGSTLDYNRPPRLLPPGRATEFALPSEPHKPEKTPLPLALIIAPMIMAGGMYAFIRSPYVLMFAVMSPVLAIANYSSGRKTAKRRYRDQMTDYAMRKRRVEQDAYTALVTERALRRRDLADPGLLLLTATGPRVRLWERRPSDPDFLHARVGTGDVASDVTVRVPDREQHEGPLSWTAPDVPVAIPLADVGVTGIAGPDAIRRAVARWVVAQAATLHSPADLEIILLADAPSAPDWSWVRWLPHCRPGDGGGAVARAGFEDESVQALVRQLLAILQGRLDRLKESGSRGLSFPPVLVVMDGARRLRLLPGMVSLLQDGPRLGLFFLCLDAEARQLPEECRALVTVPDPRTGELRVAVSGRADVEGLRPDLVDVAWCERVARALAPIRDVSSEDLAGSLPSSSRLLSVLKLDPPSPSELAARWARGGRTTAAVVGEGLDGPLTLDIKRDGPHGLIAGTTGSGKSELLQTIIASLAVGNRPDEMTFVLIDYKGGAAFKDCDHLPHTVGMVTDLDGHLTTRALESLAAELRRREHQLAGAGAKDIEDYLAGMAPGDDPMPRLLIVIDEFAALVAELPDFVTGLVDIARRGRSLGVHLILATQRPAGVVSAEIKSNTNLRIALRVTDANDSQDVLESTDAAAISKNTPGRAYARLGASSLIPFQSSRVGGRPRGADTGAALTAREFGWRSLLDAPASSGGGESDDQSIPTDLAALVAAIGKASELAGVKAPPSPWLPPLPEVLTLEDLPPTDPLQLAFGLVDVPSLQSRSVGGYDLVGGGHLGVIGATRSGRSAVLRAVAGAAARTVSPDDVHLYGVDCGNNALLPLLALPHTGAVVTRDQPDRLNRLTARLRQVISERQQLLAEKGYADLREQREHAAPGHQLPYLLVLFDRWEGFVSAFDSYDAGRLIDEWLQILQEGAGVGIKVVASGDRTMMVGRISTLVDDKLVLRLTDPSDYGNIGLRAKEVPDHMPPGRGFRSEGLRETQVALLAADPAGTAQVAALQQLGRDATARFGVPAHAPFRVDALPPRIDLADALALGPDTMPATMLPIAVGGDTLTLMGLDAVDHGPGLLVVGPRRSGRSTALKVLAAGALARRWPTVVITPRTSPLRELTGVTAFTLESDRAEVEAAITALTALEQSLLLIDDLELLGLDGWLVDAITEHVGGIRDKAGMVAAAGSIEDLGSSYRGPAVALKRSRSGLLLSPQSSGDGDIFGARLPRSVAGGALLPGRGLLVRTGALQGVQVPLA